MRRWIRQVVWVSAAWVAISAGAFAQDTGAISNGSWSDPTIWTTSTVPGSSNNVYIGSTYPAGAVSVATVTLSAAQSANNVYLGYTGGTSGTLDLAGNVLTITASLFDGYYGGTGSVNEGGGSFTAANVYVGNGNSLTFGANDAVSYLQLSGASSAATAATGNVTGNSDVLSGSTLTLGADMTLTGTLNVQDSGSIFNMAGHNLTANELELGWNGSSAVTLQNAGNINVTNLLVGNSQTFNINASDTVTNFYLSGGSSILNNSVSYLRLQDAATATTTATGSVTGNSDVLSGSTLTLGADMTLTGTLNVQDSGSIFNMAGHNLTANELELGWNGSSAVTLQNAGNINVTNLLVGNSQTFNINASDTVTNFYLSGGSSTLNNSVSYLRLQDGATATTTATGSVTGNSDVLSGSTLTLGADMTLTGTLNVQDSGSIFNMAGHNLTASELELGWNGSSAVTLQNPGNINVTNLLVGNGQTFNINASDTVTNFYLSGGSSTLNNSVSYLRLQDGATATTTTTGSVTGNSDVLSGSTLTLGADMTLTGTLNVQDSGSIFNMAGHNLTASELELGWNGSSAVTLQNPGNINVTNLLVGNGQTFNINASDTVTNFYLSGGSSTLNNSVSYLRLQDGATATTTATGSVTGNSDVLSGGTLTLGANMTLTGTLNVQDSGSTFNAQGHALTADTLLAGWNGTSAVSVTNLGLVTLNSLFVGNGTALTLHGGDVVNSEINLSGNSVLTVQQMNGIGLTLNGTSLSSLTIDPSSMDLIFNLNTSPNWDFRWADPSSGGNWISTIDSMIVNGQIVITAPQGFEVIDQGGYTYVEGFYSSNAVPEPSSLVLACIATVGIAVAARWKSRRSGR